MTKYHVGLCLLQDRSQVIAFFDYTIIITSGTAKPASTAIRDVNCEYICKCRSQALIML